MEQPSFYTRQMLLQYGKQLIAARRLARYEMLTGRRRQTEDDARARRQALVERITREIIENLIFSGSDNPIVREVRKCLDREMGQEHVFRYPPDEDGFLIVRKTREGGEEALSPEEAQSLMKKLWEVAPRVVDATML